MAKSLSELIRDGEDSATEFKCADFRNESLAKEIVAFSNMSGGSILIGIEDDGTISGTPAHDLEERMINICRNLVEPSVIPDIYAHVTDSGAKVLELRIPKGTFKPYQIKNTRRFYVRIGSVSIEPSTQELVRLLQSGGVYHFEVTSLPGTTLADIDLLRVRTYCEHYRTLEFDATGVERLLTNWQLIDAQGQCTVTGALFFGKSIARVLPQAGIQLFRFAGCDRTGRLLDQRDLVDPVPEAIAAAVNFVQVHSAVRSVFPADSTRRIDIHDYDLFAARELIVNACCHRDWSVYGQKSASRCSMTGWRSFLREPYPTACRWQMRWPVFRITETPTSLNSAKTMNWRKGRAGVCRKSLRHFASATFRHQMSLTIQHFSR